MKIYVILIAILLILIISILSLIVALREQAHQIKTLKNDNKVLNANVMSLVKYADLIAKLRKEKEEVNSEILQAENADDVMDIINHLINTNNTRLSNSTADTVSTTPGTKRN